MGDKVQNWVVMSGKDEVARRGWTMMSEYSQGMEERENPDRVPGTNTSGETRQNRVIRKRALGWGRGDGGRGRAVQGPYSLSSCEARAAVGSGSEAGTQSIRFLLDGLTNESLGVGGRAGDLSPGGKLGLRRHTLSSFSI